MKLWTYIKENMMKHPYSKIGTGQISLTYEEMCIFAELFAKRLTEKSYGVVCSSELSSAMAILACIAAGKTVIPVPTRYGIDVYRKILNKADPPCVISDIGGELRVIPLSDTKDRVGDSYKKSAVILFTSGSTGEPKGVMLSEENIISNIRSIASYFPICDKDTVLISRPLYHSSALTGEFLLSLTKGCNVVFYSESFSPLPLLKIMREQEVTVYGSTPTLMATLSRFVKSDNELKIRLLSISGECMTEGYAKVIRNAFPKAEIYCGYGLSEASPRVAYLPANMFDSYPTSAGIPVADVSVRIVNSKGNDVKKNCVGELLVKGKNVMLGYFRDCARSARALRDGWLHTGDLAKIGDDGFLYIKGRKDDMIIRAGMNIYPAEIENTLSKDPRVEKLCVYGYYDGNTQQVGLKIKGSFCGVEEVRCLCREKLPSYQIPSTIEIVEVIPSTPSGKKRKK